MTTFSFPLKNSITRRIGFYFIVIISVASLISAISLTIMWSNKSDASLVNVSGSLRMQSYRFLYEMEHHPERVFMRLQEYQDTLNAPEIQDSLHNSYFSSTAVRESYIQLTQYWAQMETYIVTGNRHAYLAYIGDYAKQVNQFVLDIQSFVELKLYIAISVVVISMLLIVMLAYFGVWYTKTKIIKPLDKLVIASKQVQNEEFDHIELSVDEPNEIGFLCETFTQMSSELAKLYASLEEKVEDKTRRLISVNRALLVLFKCSQELTSKPIDKAMLSHILQTVLENERLAGIEIQIYGADHLNVTIDHAPEQSWRSNEVVIENEKLALLRWKPSLLCPDERLIQNVSEMIGRSLYVIQMQKQQHQLILMEERSIIARELHDSLAQSLTFFKIQISLLKRNGETAQNWEKQKLILTDFEKAVNEAYSQLRELLVTFRLTIEEANLSRALERVIDSLKERTSAQIRLCCKLPSLIFSGQQQVHLLQIVREAVNNAIKHANASIIDVIAETNEEGENCLIIRDNGKGIESSIEPKGHYGLTIMAERSAELKAEFSIKSLEKGGTEVLVVFPNMLNS